MLRVAEIDLKNEKHKLCLLYNLKKSILYTNASYTTDTHTSYSISLPPRSMSEHHVSVYPTRKYPPTLTYLTDSSHPHTPLFPFHTPLTLSSISC